MGKLVAWGVGVAVVLGASQAHAATWWVDQAAAAGGDGSQAKPFQTIGDAIGAMSRGDTLLIESGTYVETPNFWNLPGSSGRTYVQADTGASVVIDGSGATDYVVQAGTPEMTFQGLTVQNGGVGFEFYQSQADGGQVIGCKTLQTGTAVEFYFSSQGYVFQSDLVGSVAGKGTDGTILESNRIHDSGAEGITLHDNSKNCQYLHNVVYDNTSVNIYLDSCSNMLVDGNLVYMTGDPPAELAGIQMADESYPDLSGPVLSDVVIVNNVVFNAYYGIVFWSGDYPGQSGMKNLTIENNTIVDSKSVGFTWDQGAHQNTIVRDNVFANEAGVGLLALVAKSTTGVTLDHNLFDFPGVAEPYNWGGGTTYDHAGWVAASGQGAGDVLAAPGFAGPFSLPDTNFALAQGSPAIDVGAPSDVSLDHDYLGNQRPFGAGYDLGAFEFGAPPAPDGGVPPVPDGGSPPDGGGGADGGTTGSGGGGCGCTVVASPAAGGAPLFALGLMLVRRRRRRPSA
jgi:MYXO-CTERM domain-containing protein